MVFSARSLCAWEVDGKNETLGVETGVPLWQGTAQALKKAERDRLWGVLSMRSFFH